MFQVETDMYDICKRCSHVTPLKLGIAVSFLLVHLLPFQLPGNRKLGNTSTLLPIVQLQQEVSRTLFAVHQLSPHGIQLFLVADPILLFLKTFAQDVKALLVSLTISTTASQDVASPTSGLQKAGEALQCATCLPGIITNAIASLNGKPDNLTD